MGHPKEDKLQEKSKPRKDEGGDERECRKKGVRKTRKKRRRRGKRIHKEKKDA